jgi:ABC-type bacteriocin/lantibiotic exporter with double-glycine peptidase domain
LDSARESEVIENLRWRFAGKTLICITHKPQMTSSADHIVRIESGRAAYVGVAG